MHVEKVSNVIFAVSVGANVRAHAQAESVTAYTAALARCVAVKSSPTINAGFTVHMV